ncbi:3-oxoacyl-[acyl-carrier-protein] synthase III C-terminal domain-containing protein [Nevskia ramosa]|uniref:3-oxoacyl-[acyl-carrier-protein] synthase III C-terminal domain-containing protein n=1 Tax=Nevskia ramosa TaxID=64002 RepID=UPI0003B41721|nr:3-oxoacyl-[acyl-carrier-protein] synthase III C-terminal domain-containing protein [Nevskia ramosa]
MSRSTRGIVSYGAHIPRLRISRAAIAEAHAWALPGLKGQAKGERALCSWDEDAITLAVAAARDAVRDNGRAAPAALTLASTTAPFADLQNAVIVASALNLSTSTQCSDLAGSTRAGLSALAQALESGAEGDALVVAADRRSAKPGSAQEMQFGAGAAAIQVGEDASLAKYLGRESVSHLFVDHFRATGEKHDYYWEERWIRDEGVAKVIPAAVKRLLAKTGRAATDVKWFGLAGAPSGSDKLVAKALGIAPEQIIPDLAGTVGDCGTAHAPLQLIHALENARPGDLIVVAAFGQGCEVLAFEMGEGSHRPATGLAKSIAARIPETSYMKMASFEGEIDLEWGMRAETDVKAALTQHYRSADQINAFVGGRCKVCNTVQFPRLPNCVSCAAPDSQTPFNFADELGQVATFSADWLQFYLAPPLYVGLVQFDVGSRLLMEIVEVGAAGIDVGTRLSMQFRIKARDRKRHYSRYFWKAVPVR